MQIYKVFIKYCVFSKDFRIFRTMDFLCFPLVSVCVHTSAAAELAEVRKNHKILMKKPNI